MIRVPPERPRALNASSRRGGGRDRGHPHLAVRAHGMQQQRGGDPREDQRRNPPRGGPPDLEGDPQHAHISWGAQGRTETRSPHDMCACWGSPSRSGGPPLGGFLRWSSRGSPPSLLLHAVGAHRWVGVPPIPPPPLRLLALSARGRSGGTLRHCRVSRAPRRALSPRDVVPPCCPLGCACPPRWPHY